MLDTSEAEGQITAMNSLSSNTLTVHAIVYVAVRNLDRSTSTRLSVDHMNAVIR